MIGNSDWNGFFLTYTPPPSPYLWDQGKVSLGKGREAPFHFVHALYLSESNIPKAKTRREIVMPTEKKNS